jgi:siroheme synthase (precorrin-2 oxidase/ferrochelatase)
MRTHVCARNLLGEEALQCLKRNPALIPQLRKQLESCLKTKIKENRIKSIEVKDPSFTVIYHTFFSPIIWRGKKGSSHKQPQEVSIEEMKREIENFNPDRHKDFRLWWAKEKYKEKNSKIDENKKEKLIKLFYKVIKGDLEIDKYHRELNSL